MGVGGPGGGRGRGVDPGPGGTGGNPWEAGRGCWGVRGVAGGRAGNPGVFGVLFGPVRGRQCGAERSAPPVSGGSPRRGQVRGLPTAYLPDRGTCRVRETVPRSGDALPPGGGRERKGKRVPWSGQRCRRPSSAQPVTRSDRPRWPDCGAEGFEAPRVRAPQGVRGGRPRVRGPQQPPPGILARLQIPAPESRGVPPLGKSFCWRGCREGGFQGGELRRGRAGTGCALA